MIFRTHLLMDHGVVLPGHRLAFTTRYTGALLLHEELDPVRNRHVMVARIGDEVPPLYDAKVVKISVDFMVITGFERIQRDIVSQTVEYAQSWFLESGAIS